MDLGFHAALWLLRVVDKPQQPDKVDKVLDAVAEPLTKAITTAIKYQRAVGKIKELTGIDLMKD